MKNSQPDTTMGEPLFRFSPSSLTYPLPASDHLFLNRINNRPERPRVETNPAIRYFEKDNEVEQLFC